jgi:H+/Na+-translocating ferredoxin:NAD+ oxidoreductase subunit B
MSDQVYRKLAGVLDTLPNGFPATESGIEIKILKKIFTPEEADLVCDLKLTPETPEQIAERTGRPLEGLDEMLASMQDRGEIFGRESNGIRTFKLMPWVVGIYEFQLKRMDREFAEMCKKYSVYWGAEFLKYKPQIMQVIPIEKQIPVHQEALTYEQVSGIIDAARSFMVNECICKKTHGILGQPCDRPLEVCMAMDPEPDAFENSPWGGRIISKEEAYELIRKSEELGLVHMTSNIESGHWFICNCCGCCCGLLRAINMGLSDVVNSYYYAQINADACEACGICADERCQVNAIERGEKTYRIIKKRCIGCGLCVTTCPAEAVRLIRKEEAERVKPPKDEDAWYEERARRRGVDFSAYK